MKKLTLLGFSIFLCLLLIYYGCNKDVEGEYYFNESVIVSSQKNIPQIGDSISLKGIGYVVFDFNSFNTNTKVTLKKSSIPECKENFEMTSNIFGVTNSLDYEFVINTGVSAPTKSIKVYYKIPDTFINQLQENSGIQILAEYFSDDSIETHDNFDVIPSTISLTSKIIEFNIDPMYFSNVWSNDNTYQTIIKMVICSGEHNMKKVIMVDNSCAGQFIGCPTNSCFVTSPFGERTLNGKKGFHRGIDLRAPMNTPVYAASDGKVLYSGYQYNSKAKTGWGNYIVIENVNTTGQRYATLYAHLSSKSVTTNASVKEGAIIGLSGNSGGSKNPHLHFEYIVNANISDKTARINPSQYINTTSPRLISATANCTAVNDMASGTRSSWKVNFIYKDPLNTITPDATITFQDVEPVLNSPYTVLAGSITSTNGLVTSPSFSAHFGTLTYFKVKAYITLKNGSQSNCIYFILKKPAGAAKSSIKPSSSLD